MSRPAVCVVVPVYRAEATLDRCVQSILAQDVGGGLACILVDDGEQGYILGSPIGDLLMQDH